MKFIGDMRISKKYFVGIREVSMTCGTHEARMSLQTHDS